MFLKCLEFIVICKKPTNARQIYFNDMHLSVCNVIQTPFNAPTWSIEILKTY